jgi:hypothetical protein
VELRTLIAAAGQRGVHLVCAAGAEAIAAAALLGKALRRAHIATAGVSVLGWGERVDSPATRAWLADAPALLLVGLPAARALGDVPQLSIDARPARGSDGEPLAARAFALGETLAQLGDASWCAAVGLVERSGSHVLVERARSRHALSDLSAIAALLDAAARGPDPATDSLAAVEMLIATPDPRRFVGSVAAELLRRTQELVRAELMRTTRLRPRPGFGVVVVEYDSACHVEDLVAERWRGLRPGTVVLVANHGAGAGLVALTARAALPEAVDDRLGRLHAALGDEGAALVDADTWTRLRAQLGVTAPAAVEPAAAAAFELSALPN